RLRLPQLRTLLKVGIPSGVQAVADVLAWAAWGNVVMALFGTKAMAGTNFVFRYMSVSFMPALGIGTAVTALVGRYIGRKRPDIAVQRAHLGFKVAAVYMLACAAVFILFRRALMSLFAADPQVMAIGSMMLVFAGVYQLFDAIYIVYYGALRGAGDTFVPAVATAALNWGITVANGPKRLQGWRDQRLYEKLLTARAASPRGKWVLHDGPPFANGDIHIGHVINKVLKDVVLRFRSMQGYQTPYVPGWDCHGLPIEHKIQQELGPRLREMSIVDVRKRCFEYAAKYVKVQSEQFQRLGILGEWENPYLTMSAEYEADT